MQGQSASENTQYSGIMEDRTNSPVISLHGRAERGAYFSRYRSSEIPKHRGWWSLQMSSAPAFHLPWYPVFQPHSQTDTFPCFRPMQSAPPYLHLCLQILLIKRNLMAWSPNANILTMFAADSQYTLIKSRLCKVSSSHNQCQAQETCQNNGLLVYSSYTPN